MYVFSLSELFVQVGCGRNEGFPKSSHSEMSSMMFYADGSKILGNQLRYVYLVGGNWIIHPNKSGWTYNIFETTIPKNV